MKLVTTIHNIRASIANYAKKKDWVLGFLGLLTQVLLVILGVVIGIN